MSTARSGTTETTPDVRMWLCPSSRTSRVPLMDASFLARCVCRYNYNLPNLHICQPSSTSPTRPCTVSGRHLSTAVPPHPGVGYLQPPTRHKWSVALRGLLFLVYLCPVGFFLEMSRNQYLTVVWMPFKSSNTLRFQSCHLFQISPCLFKIN
ncbi:uncharacterized protein CYBJADRAFT_169610 [Cyberlindnera jadinii NRRL Y-1542]|uniref:Uncharacterized protein n=1 Tax=Cyberlindnera jadinii (strain ATCC 18201 / CBS 1600 / BCRC 20928 / JCM 3617 / NBRC 0987 / NRRL Y-1542) TaxID=983966 RepID=A0A1E4RVH6_CYBJN|nr:hypothetical protein CYBJADRAFT_169610 [Cyberlindnera jadinii NRRL Y-1542]ODV71201.1 hypothetical protein CYBJADRAFT_169610 [Cyberlindnera jadinii NRRL Y-1542]